MDANHDIDALTNSLNNALIPFGLAERWNQPVGYERSFKLSHRGLLSNRYLIGIPVSTIGFEEIVEAVGILQMPEEWHATFKTRLPRATMFFMGFEESLEVDCLKVYLEFSPGEFPTQLSHIGWKWACQSQSHTQRRLTWYYRVDAKRDLDVLQLVNEHCTGRQKTSLLAATRIMHRLAGSSVQFTSVRERTGRRSFDLNVYSANLPLKAFEQELYVAAEAYGIPSDSMARLIELCGACTVGHIAGGSSAQHSDFLTVYYSMD